jgi:GNAT superfamily N-acetyltransferase
VSAEVAVRPAGPDDAEALERWVRQHAAFEGAPEPPADVAASLAAALAAGRVRIWLAERDGTSIGYAAATVDFSTFTGACFLHLDCLYVADRHRGGGVGAALFRTVGQAGIADGLGEMQWQTPSWNVDAQRFYARQGAEATVKMRYRLNALPRGVALA